MNSELGVNFSVRCGYNQLNKVQKVQESDARKAEE